MKLYRGLTKAYRPELVNPDGHGTDFTDCPFTALTFARGATGQVIVLDIDEGQTLIKFTREFWGEKKATRYIVWNNFDIGISQIVPAKILRKAILAKGMRTLCDADKSLILTKVISVQTKKLSPAPHFVPPVTEEGDEFFPNGIFEFNITKLLTHIRTNPEKFPVEQVENKGLRSYSPSTLDEATVLKADVTTPIILGEIAPDRFNVIDGNHRLERAHREGLKAIPLYRVFAKQHMAFLTSVESYTKYIEYWNAKINDSWDD